MVTATPRQVFACAIILGSLITIVLLLSVPMIVGGMGTVILHKGTASAGPSIIHLLIANSSTLLVHLHVIMATVIHAVVTVYAPHLGPILPLKIVPQNPAQVTVTLGLQERVSMALVYATQVGLGANALL